LLPRDRLVWRGADGEVVPGWLTEADQPWLRDMLDAFEAADGERQRALLHLIREAPHQAVSTRKLNMVSHVLAQRVDPVKPPVSPRLVRARVFGLAQAQRRDGPIDHSGILRDISAELGVDAADSMFANVPPERRVTLSRPLPTPPELKAEVNLALAQGLVRRSLRVEIDLDAGARDIVRAVQLRRLLYVARHRPGGGMQLEISGVCSLFRRTTLYGRALASIVPRLAWCGRFAMRAWCLLDGKELLLRLGHKDGLKPSRPPRRYDSQLEARFAADFARTAPEWTLTREPKALKIGNSLVFPDFGIEQHGRHWLMEIVGFWTPDYLHRKLEMLRGTGVLLCIDERLACGEDDVRDLPVVWFRRRIEPSAVLEALSRLEPTPVREACVDRLQLRSYFIDYAGRKPPSDDLHRRLDGIRIGTELKLQPREGQCFLATEDGPVAALSARERDTWSTRADRIRWVRVIGLEERRRAQSGPAYRHLLQVDRWLVPIVEIGWMP